MSETAAIAFLHALTGLHPGSGTALGVVDLPVQRERHTDWPTIPGSSLKGVFRDASRRRPGGSDPDGSDSDEVQAVFGPSPVQAHEHAGAVAFTDARLMAFPVRSLAGVFALVTCPAVIARLRRDCALVAGRPLPADIVVPEVADDKVLCVDPAKPLLAGDKVILEEFDFEPATGARALADWLARHTAGDDTVRDQVRQRLVIVSDDQFGHFVRHATEVVARIGLDQRTKTVKAGALFYQEFLPPETLFYTLVLAHKSRKQGREMGADAILAALRNAVPAGSVLQIGGDETIGRGLCAVAWA